MKKTLALVLALAMVFSTITVAFAEDTLGEDAQICADLGMLKGESGTVDAAYVATAPTRLQAAVMFLRLKGLEAEALAFTGEDNFADGNIAWAEGANLIAYLKANPQLGWVGDGTNFNPTAAITAQQYYKVLLESLGYKQTTAEVAGDFTYEEVFTFAASVGLTKVAEVENFTVNDLAIATVEALKVNVKGTEKTLAATLVEAGKIDQAKAAEAGLVAAVPTAVEAAVEEVTALGNKVVQVEYEDDVDEASAGSVDNYSIEGLEINSVVVTGTNLVRLETAAMSAGKLYTLTVGEQSVKFAGVAKDSDAPLIDEVESEDVEEVVITFDMNVDFTTATDVASYSINGVTVVAAEVDKDDANEVTLTTEGLKDKTSYVVKVSNMKSIDGVNRKATSENFKTKFDTTAPKIKGAVSVRTNERIKVTFDDEVTKETAEDLANYSIKLNKTDGAILEVVSVTWDDDDEDNVTIITEPMEKNKEYKLSISNIADQKKVPNVMTRPSTATFKAVKPDEDAPKWENPVTLSPTAFTLKFIDASMLDEASVLDIGNYALEDDDADLDIESIDKLDSGWDKDHYYYEALFTVEEMENGAKPELTFIDILDEFGNAIDKDKSVKIDTNKRNYASAELTVAYIVDENTMVLLFDKALDEATAESIANYSINNDIGSPKKAVYEDEDTDIDHSVTLTVNDLIDNRQYKISVDGVNDIAGNTLKFASFKTTPAYANAKHWDKTAPKLEDVDILNKYVIALTFDEQVEIKDNSGSNPVQLEIDVDGDGTAELFNAKVRSDNNTVVEFSLPTYNEINGVAWAGFEDKEYTVTALVYNATYGIKDYNGNQFVWTVGETELVDGSDDDPDYVELDSYKQLGGTFELTMSGDVKAVATSARILDKDGNATGSPIAFAASTEDNDYDSVVYLDGKIIEDEEYEFNLAGFLTDGHGMPAINDEVTISPAVNRTVLEADETDEDRPEIDDITAVSRYKVEIEFSEYVTGPVVGKFHITNLDLDKKFEPSKAYVKPAGETYENHDNIVVLEFSDANALEARYEYELVMDDNAVADYAGNKALKDTIVFDGSNLAQPK